MVMLSFQTVSIQVTTSVPVEMQPRTFGWLGKDLVVGWKVAGTRS